MVSRLLEAVEALKRKAPVADKKTAFWSAYKTLADEHDKEFQQRYSTDLDTALIFAGLFSAVDSAFIIQIQPEIRPHGTRLVVLVAQNLLYLSLFSTLLAALLAVLGKQWLMHYLSAGERGTIEARGLERQRKFDGLRKWKFDVVMQTFPLLLQIGLFLFSAALSIYLWRVHMSLAIIVLSFTSLGFMSYTALLVSAIVDPDSPFQTPLAPLVVSLIPTSLWSMSRLFFNRLTRAFFWLFQCFFPVFSSPRVGTRNLLPIFLNGQLKYGRSEPDGATAIFDAPFPASSPEVPAVSWVLETSTDPWMIELAAEMVVDLQWSSTMDVRPQLNRLQDSLLRCFDFLRTSDGTSVLIGTLDGMTLPAIHLGQAYCALRWVLRSGNFQQPSQQIFHYAHTDIQMLRPELANVVRNLAGEPAVITDPEQELTTKWALRVIPSIVYTDSTSRIKNLEYFLDQFNEEIPTLDSQSFTDYLLCISSFLSAPSTSDMSWMDKREFQSTLLGHIFNGILTHLEIKKISMHTTARIIDTTGRLARKEGNYVWHYSNSYSDRQSMIHQFCSSLPQTDGWVDVVLATGLLTETYYPDIASCSGNTLWIYKALESVNKSTEDYQWDSRTPKWAVPGPISTSAACLLLQDNVADWYRDDQMSLILQEASVWSALISAALKNSHLHKQCIQLGNILVSISDWKPFLLEELSSWITIFFCQEAKSSPS
ncbi:hypothetical protein MVEN_01389000 [Mycena venus]|uniref:DUF6535 domain-containing protein n=1 Tax=Mycena venus TaxID=2733690 RepID=A0A8H7CUH7_9AGAR|nr:hypothetical protein MVEN_01389000 [Mycena venus]